jgi:hypothetical protein
MGQDDNIGGNPGGLPWGNSDPSRIGSRAGRDTERTNFRARAESERRTGRRTRPRASTASRSVAMRSRGSVRGTIISPLDDRVIQYESVLERDLAYILFADPRVKLVREQVGPVFYAAADGSQGEHYFDFVATLRDGSEHAIAVKYVKDVEKSGIRDVLDRINAKGTLVGRGILRTETQITRVKADNARLVLHANRVADLDEVAALQRFLTTVHGVASLENILRAAGLCSPGGFYAAVRLFGLGFIKSVDGGMFSHTTRVRVNSAELAE